MYQHYLENISKIQISAELISKIYLSLHFDNLVNFSPQKVHKIINIKIQSLEMAKKLISRKIKVIEKSFKFPHCDWYNAKNCV